MQVGIRPGRMSLDIRTRIDARVTPRPVVLLVKDVRKVALVLWSLFSISLYLCAFVVGTLCHCRSPSCTVKSTWRVLLFCPIY